MIEREELPGQMCLFDPPEAERVRRDHLLRDPAKYTQISCDDLRRLPDGTEIIVLRQGSDYKPEHNHYYRSVTWIVQTRYGGHDVRLVSEPTEEWPETPPWLASDRGQWMLPRGFDLYYVRKEQET